MNNVNIESLLHPVYPLIMIAIVSIAILVLSDLLVVRKAKVSINSTSGPTTT
jgi:hypothetical protein